MSALRVKSSQEGAGPPWCPAEIWAVLLTAPVAPGSGQVAGDNGELLAWKFCTWLWVNSFSFQTKRSQKLWWVAKNYYREVKSQWGQVSACRAWEKSPFWSQQPGGIALAQASSQETKAGLALWGIFYLTCRRLYSVLMSLLSPPRPPPPHLLLALIEANTSGR